MEPISGLNAYPVVTVLISVLNIIAYLALWLFIHVAKSAMKELKELRAAHYNLVAVLPIDYVRGQVYLRDIREIKETLEKIWSVLNKKVDRGVG